MKRFYLYCVIAVLFIGCNLDGSTSSSGAGDRSFEIERKSERGPATLYIRVSKQEITLAQVLELELEVQVDEAYQVELPSFGDKLQQFGIRDYQALPSKLLDKNIVSKSIRYTLEPFLSGEYEIPALTAKFWKGEEESKHSLESEPLKINVTSIIGSEGGELPKLRDVTGPASMAGVSKTVWIVAGVALLVLLGALILIYKKLVRKPVTEVQQPAHERAYDALADLVSKKLIEAGKHKEFYHELSAILRHYIEDRFKLKAPERTTEEFLGELKMSMVFNSAQRDLLKEFLTHCDLVKFARLTPETEDIQKTFDACKNFIEETKVVGDATTDATSGGQHAV